MTELSIRLICEGSGGFCTIATGDPALAAVGSRIRDVRADQVFVVLGAETVLDKDGRFHLQARIRPADYWYGWLDRWSRTHDVIYPLLSTALVFAVGAPILLLYLFLAAPPDTREAYLGVLVAAAPWPLFILTSVWAIVVAMRIEDRFGKVISYGIAFSLFTWGTVFAIFWQIYFVAGPPLVYPSGYAELAGRFKASRSAIVAVATGYAPLILVTLKAFKLETIAIVLAIALGLKAAD